MQTYLGAGTADLADVTVVYLSGFRWLLGSELLVLEGGLLIERVSTPGGRRCHRCYRLLLLLLLLVVAGGCRVHGCFVARVGGSWSRDTASPES